MSTLIMHTQIKEVSESMIKFLKKKINIIFN